MKRFLCFWMMLWLTLPALAEPEFPTSTAAEKELLAAARLRYPGKHRRGNFYMAYYRLLADGRDYLALTDDGGSLLENNRYKGALWRYRHGHWAFLDTRPAMTYDDRVWRKLGIAPSVGNRLMRYSDVHVLRPCVCTDPGPDTPIVRALRRVVAERFPGAWTTTVDYAVVVPYHDTAFGATVGTPPGLDTPLYAIWERKGHRWSWIFEFYWWPGSDTSRPSPTKTCLDRLFAQYHFSSAMRMKLMAGIYHKLAP